MIIMIKKYIITFYRLYITTFTVLLSLS